VKLIRTYRAFAAVKEIVTVFAVVGLKVYVADATSVEKFVPSVLPSTDRVWVRVAHDVDGGSLSTTLLMLFDAPRSACTHCGKALLLLSQ
jgi:hypothetical protein